MKMNNVYFLTFDDTYHKFEILKCGNALFTKYYVLPRQDVCLPRLEQRHAERV